MSFFISTSDREGRQAKAYVTAFFTVFVSLLAVVGGINLIVDPSRQFGLSLRYEQRLANMLLRDEDVTTAGSFNIHVVRRDLLNGTKVTPQAMIFGSSRTWDVRQSMFPTWRFMNAGTNSAALDDYIALWGLIEERRVKPRLLVIGADPWIFNRANPPLAHCTKLAHEFRVAARALGGVSVDRCLSSPAYRELLSLNRLMTSFRFLEFEHNNKGCDFCAVPRGSGMPPAGDLWHPDGSMNHFRDQPASVVATAAREQGITSPRFKFFEGMTGIDERLTTDWRKLLRRVQAEGVAVVIYLSPFHPDYIAGIAGHRPTDIDLLHQVERKIRDIAAELNIPVIGSYDPNVAKCGIDEYFDSIHIRPTCIARLLAQAKLPSHSAASAEPVQ